MSYKVPGYFSPSSLSSWHQCPKRFYYEKIEKMRSPGTDATVRGSFVHEVLEELLGLPSDERTIEQAKLLMRNLWDSKWEDEATAIDLSDTDLHKLRWSAWWCIENYFKMEDPTKFEPQGLEVKIEGRIDGVPIFGIIDRWSLTEDGKIRIGDYKTGKVPKPQYSGEKKLQIMIYADLMEQQTGYEAACMDLLYVKDAKLVTYKPTKQLRENTAFVLAKAWDEMSAACETETFHTQTGPLCGWCHFKPICPAFNEGVS